MRLTRNIPGAGSVFIFVDGVEQKRCYAADDVLGIALCGVLTTEGKDNAAPFYRDWAPGEFEYQDVVVRWVRGAVEFRFDPPEKGTLARSCWQHFIPHDAMWALGELIAARGLPE